MRKKSDVNVVIKPINMSGGGYLNFLKKIKTDSITDCLAKFIVVDGDRINNDFQERRYFFQLLEYCSIHNRRRDVPYFLIVNNPDFEYVACLHFDNYKNQACNKFLLQELGYQNIEQFKGNKDVYKLLNVNNRSYQTACKCLIGKDKLVSNKYAIKKKSFEISVKETLFNEMHIGKRCSNIEEFFNVIDW